MKPPKANHKGKAKDRKTGPNVDEEDVADEVDVVVTEVIEVIVMASEITTIVMELVKTVVRGDVDEAVENEAEDEVEVAADLVVDSTTTMMTKQKTVEDSEVALEADLVILAVMQVVILALAVVSVEVMTNPEDVEEEEEDEAPQEENAIGVTRKAISSENALNQPQRDVISTMPPHHLKILVDLENQPILADLEVVLVVVLAVLKVTMATDLLDVVDSEDVEGDEDEVDVVVQENLIDAVEMTKLKRRKALAPLPRTQKKRLLMPMLKQPQMQKYYLVTKTRKTWKKPPLK